MSRSAYTEEGEEVAFDPTLLIAALVEAAGGEVILPLESVEGKGLFGKYLYMDIHKESNTMNLSLKEEV